MQFTQLGPYRVVRKLGRGGMGTVFEAVHGETGETVAIKVLATALSEDKDSRQRFAAEIESLKRLNHPNIVRLFGYGEQDGHAYYVMELVPGTNLELEIQSGRRFTWREVVHLAIQLCRALRHAHDRGIIHRDIKPANLLATPGGDVKLSDFGIARLFGLSGITSHGGVVGTAEYMAPEQAMGKPVSPQSDLYSLGTVMFTLLAGRTPFEAATVKEMLQLQRFAEAQPVSEYAPHVPVALEELIAQLLQKSPEKRLANAAVLGRQLDALENMSGIHSAAFNDPPTRVSDTNIAEQESDEFPGNPLASTQVTQTEPVLSGSSGARRAAAGKPPTEPSSQRNAGGGLPPKRAPINHHVSIHELGRLERPRPNQNPWRQTLQIAMPATGLALIVAGIWYATRPPSADHLEARIEAVAAEKREDGMLDAEKDLEDFLARFPDDPRAAKMQVYLDGVILDRLDRRLRLLAAIPGSEKDLPPAMAELLKAMRLSLVDPVEARARLTALIAEYDRKSDGPTTRQCVGLARRYVERLKQQSDDAQRSKITP